MGPPFLGAMILTCLLCFACAGSNVEVEQYPPVEQRGGETIEGGEQTPAKRAEPPTDPTGPLPADGLAGEEVEPL